MKMTWTLCQRATVLLLFVQAFFLTTANTQPYPYIPYADSSFNNSGSIHLNNFVQVIPQKLALQPDGKILTAGYMREVLSQDLDGVVYRVNADGTLDTGFGTDGYVRLDVDGTHDVVQGVKVLPNNKIMLLLASGDRNLLVQLLPDGTLDPDFGNEGLLLADTPPYEVWGEFLVQEDQKIILVGYQDVVNSTLTRGIVRRFNPDGSPDNTFGNNGSRSVVIDPGKDLKLFDCVLQSDGKLLATGPYSTGASSGFIAVRLNTDGSFDNTFSGDGIYLKVMGAVGKDAHASAIAVRSDGNIYIAGAAPTVNEIAMAVVAVSPAGGIITSFGNFGTTKIVITPQAGVWDIIIQPDNKLLLAGACVFSNPSVVSAHARLLPNGAIDNTFGLSTPSGVFVSIFDGLGYDLQIVVDTELQPDGRLVSLTWLNKTNSGTAMDPAEAVISRWLTDIIVATLEPNPTIHDAALSPNPAGNEQITLDFELDEAQTVNAYLFDMNGTRVATLFEQRASSAGNNKERFLMPIELPAGTYVVLLSSEKGFKALKIVKDE